MKTQKQIEDERERLVDQQSRIMAGMEFMNREDIEFKQHMNWGRCVESSVKALDWALSDEDYQIIY